MQEIAVAETDILDLGGELLLLKSLLTDYVNRYDEITEAVVQWHASFGEAMRVVLTTGSAKDLREAIVKLRESVQRRPRQVLDISAVSLLIERIGRTVERIHRIRSQGAVSGETLRRMIEQMTLVVIRHCEPELAARIERDWDRIVLEGK